MHTLPALVMLEMLALKGPFSPPGVVFSGGSHERKHPVPRDRPLTLPSVYLSISYGVTHPGELIYFITFSRKSSPLKKPTKDVSDLLF